ncbi:MAG TPA: DUF1592 domain-containing protein [Polyangiales bacterium]|nr:DUF1592 domain-containing protein [Polyangiales bacterium]
MSDAEQRDGQISESDATEQDLCVQNDTGPRSWALRRLTRLEYNNTVADLFDDQTAPADALPNEAVGNSFGNDANAQAVSSLLAEQYGRIAETIAGRVLAKPDVLAHYDACWRTAFDDASAEDECVRKVIAGLAERMYRRPLAMDELSELMDLYRAGRTDGTRERGVELVLQAVLQGPDFLYRFEWGEPNDEQQDLLRLSSYEMATRLSYLYAGSTPDDELFAAAREGRLASAEQIRAQAERLLADRTRTRVVLRQFFDKLLPIAGLTDLPRDHSVYPSFSPQIGLLLREETQTFLERSILDEEASWSTILTAPYTYLNEQLANYYGFGSVTGDEFQRVDLPADQRLGLLTQGAIMTGTTHSNFTNPVSRGAFVLKRLLCRDIPLPTGETLALVKPPDPYSGRTARERYTAHRSQPVCAACHDMMDPVGFALENFDAVGLFRTTENDVEIDTHGELLMDNKVRQFDNALEFAQHLGRSKEAMECFAQRWLDYAYGQTLTAQDACSVAGATRPFRESGYVVKELLLSTSQAIGFRFMPKPEETSQ